MKVAVSVAKWYLSLMPVAPPSYYTERKPFERAWMEYNSEANHEDAFLDNFPGLSPEGKDVLDIGSGFGGRTVHYAELGAKSVTGLEVSEDAVTEARDFAQFKGATGTFVHGFGESLPFPDSSFDSIFSYDVFEHVSDLLSVLRECYRVLRPGSTLYAVFPPVYHPTGGSHFHGYLSRSPAPNVFFRPKTLMAAMNELLSERGDYRPTVRPNDYLPSVNGTTIAGFRRYVKELPWAAASIYLRPLNISPMKPLLSVCTRIPGLREVSTSRIMAQLRK